MSEMEAKKKQEDPLTQIQQRELAIKEKELQHKIEMDKMKLELEAAKTKINKDLQEDRLESEDKREGVRIAAKLATDAAKDQKEEAKLALDAAKQLQNE
jgi:tellurite resistance protein